MTDTDAINIVTAAALFLSVSKNDIMSWRYKLIVSLDMDKL